jgi:NTE family protein
VLASACLPMLFQAVEIDGEAYWDGGYSVNPALSPLIQSAQRRPDAGADQPAAGGRHAAHPAEILDRINELTFNASLLTQMRAIDFVNRLLAEGASRTRAARPCACTASTAGGAGAFPPPAARPTPR